MASRLNIATEFSRFSCRAPRARSPSRSKSHENRWRQPHMTDQTTSKGTPSADEKEMAVREKKELVAKEEKTVPGRYFIPYTDIYETDEALGVVMEMPGVE